MPRARAARKAEAARGAFPGAVHLCAPPIGGRLVILCGAGKPAQADRRIYPGAASIALPAKVIDGRSRTGEEKRPARQGAERAPALTCRDLPLSSP